jgi:hypothetical protein
MPTKARTPEDPDEPTEPEPEEPSDARQKFNRGEITWRELVEAEG